MQHSWPSRVLKFTGLWCSWKCPALRYESSDNTHHEPHYLPAAWWRDALLLPRSGTMGCSRFQVKGGGWETAASELLDAKWGGWERLSVDCVCRNSDIMCLGKQPTFAFNSLGELSTLTNCVLRTSLSEARLLFNTRSSQLMVEKGSKRPTSFYFFNHAECIF